MPNKVILDALDTYNPSTTISFSDNTNLENDVNTSIVLPQGTVEERYSTVDGPSVLRWNSENKALELFNGSNWTVYSFQEDIDNLIISGTILFLDASSIANFNGLVWSNTYKNFNLNGNLEGSVVRDPADFGSLYFDAVDDYVNVPNFPTGNYLKLNEGWTFSFWFKADSTANYATGLNTKCLIGINDTSGGNLLRLGVAADGSGMFYSDPGSGDLRINSGTNYNNDTWYNVAFSRPYGSGAQTLTCYINGSSIGTVQSNAIDWTTMNTFYIGAEVDDINTLAPTDVFGGNISVIHVMDRQLTASEVLNNFNALRARYGV